MMVDPGVVTDAVGVGLLAACLGYQRYKKSKGVISTATTADA
jgi:hypothetical protein